MAKHCTKCNQDYADDLAECPHCAAATQTKLGGRGQERPTQLITRGNERNTQLLTQGPAMEAKDAGRNRDKVEISDAPPPQEGPSDSMVDLGSLPEETAGSESQVIMAELASNDSHAGLVSDSAVNLAEGEVVAEDEGSSVVNLGAPPVVPGEGSSAEKGGRSAVMTDASGIDIEERPPTMSDSDLHPRSGSDIDLGAEGSATPGSGIDVAPAAEATDSTSDIDMGAIPSGSPRREPAVEEPAVSEEEVNDLLAELEETPAQIAARGVAEREAAEIAEGEQAVAAAEAEEAAEAAQAEENERPPEAAKPRSPVLALAGSAVLGIVIGAGGLLGVQSLTGSGEKPKQLANLNVPQPKAAAPVPFETLAARLNSGDWDEVQTAIDQVPGANAQELVALGKYHLGSYLKNSGPKVNLEDPSLKKAVQHLQKAAEQKDPDALYDLAFIQELAGKLPEARAEYAKGVQEFANDASQKQRFEAAISRVDWKMSVKKAGAALIPQLQRGEDRALVLALLLVALQQPPQQPAQQAQQPAQQGQQPAPAPAAQVDKPEAGYEFWQAAKLAHEGKFSDAVTALDRARKLHDERRFSRLRKAQNPLSDPAEDIFLRCCDELKAYWQLENRLRDGGYLTDKNTPPEALQALVQKAQGSDDTTKDLKDKLMVAQKSQQDAEAKVADLQKKLQTASTKTTSPDGDLKAKEKLLAEREAALAAAKKDNENLKNVNDDLSAALAKTRDELAAAKNKDARSEERPQRTETAPLSAPLNRRDSRRMPNPLAAEKHFAAGLNFYFDNEYANAEKELSLAIENDSQDARFFYFLGLSRLARNRNRDAYADFNQGVALERLNRPSSIAVNESLERVQGPTRRIVNGFRENPQR